MCRHPLEDFCIAFFVRLKIMYSSNDIFHLFFHFTTWLVFLNIKLSEVNV